MASSCREATAPYQSPLDLPKNRVNHNRCKTFPAKSHSSNLGSPDSTCRRNILLTPLALQYTRMAYNSQCHWTSMNEIERLQKGHSQITFPAEFFCFCAKWFTPRKLLLEPQTDKLIGWTQLDMVLLSGFKQAAPSVPQEETN